MASPRASTRLGKPRRKRRYRSLTELLKECESPKRPCLRLHVSLQSMLQDSCIAFSVEGQSEAPAEAKVEVESVAEAEAHAEEEGAATKAKAEAEAEAEAHAEEEGAATEAHAEEEGAAAEAEAHAEEEGAAAEAKAETESDSDAEAAEAEAHAEDEEAAEAEGGATGAGGQLVPFSSTTAPAPAGISVTASQVLTAFLSRLTQQLVRAPAPPQSSALVVGSRWDWRNRTAPTVECIQPHMTRRCLREVAAAGMNSHTRARLRPFVVRLLVTFQKAEGSHVITTGAAVANLREPALTAFGTFGAPKSLDLRLKDAGTSTLSLQWTASRHGIDSWAASPESARMLQAICDKHESEDETMVCSSVSQEEFNCGVGNLDGGGNSSSPPRALQPGKRRLEFDEDACRKRARCEADEAADPDSGPVRLGLCSGRSRHYALPAVENRGELVAEQEQAGATLPAADRVAIKPPAVKSILKLAAGCKAPCACADCEGVRVRAQQAASFSQRQMQLMEDLAGRLMKELRTLRYVVDEHSAAHDDKLKEASISAVRVEHMARRCLQRMVKDCHRHCRTASSSQPGEGTRKPKRRLTFADDAGHPLCQVKLFHRMQQSHSQNNTH